jgi:4-aminobutyrate aminotransferase-like enzyme
MLTDVDGNRFVDLTGGVGVMNVGNSLAPKRRPGRTPKVDDKAKKLLNEDMKEHPLQPSLRGFASWKALLESA